MTLASDMRAHAHSKGVDLLGFTSADPIESLTMPRRAFDPSEVPHVDAAVYDPRALLPSAQSVVITGMYMYGIDRIKPSILGSPRGDIGPWTRDFGAASRFSSGVVMAFLQLRGYQAQFTTALPYRELALRSGLVNIGKNGYVYTDQYGSYLRFAAVVTDAPLPFYDQTIDLERSLTACDGCNVCVEVCPTHALKGAQDFNFGGCLHQWLQGRGQYGTDVPRHERHKLGNMLSRCGKCLTACPRNTNLKPRSSVPYTIELKEDSPELIPLVLADEHEYESKLPRAVVQYGIENMRRNVIVALGNIGDAAAVPVLFTAMQKLPETYRGYAAWALGEIGGGQAESALHVALAKESQALVRDEIYAALEQIKIAA